MILLSKSEILDDPTEFRQIAIGNTGGKVFFSGMYSRLHDYFIANNYIKRKEFSYPIFRYDVGFEEVVVIENYVLNKRGGMVPGQCKLN